MQLLPAYLTLSWSMTGHMGKHAMNARPVCVVSMLGGHGEHSEEAPPTLKVPGPQAVTVPFEAQAYPGGHTTLALAVHASTSKESRPGTGPL